MTRRNTANSGATGGNSPAMGTAIAPEAVDAMSGDTGRALAHWWFM